MTHDVCDRESERDDGTSRFRQKENNGAAIQNKFERHPPTREIEKAATLIGVYRPVLTDYHSQTFIAGGAIVNLAGRPFGGRECSGALLFSSRRYPISVPKKMTQRKQRQEQMAVAKPHPLRGIINSNDDPMACFACCAPIVYETDGTEHRWATNFCCCRVYCGYKPDQILHHCVMFTCRLCCGSSP